VLAVQRAQNVSAFVAVRLAPHAALQLAVLRLHLVLAHAVAVERTASLETVALGALRLFAHRGWVLDRRVDGNAALAPHATNQRAVRPRLADFLVHVVRGAVVDLRHAVAVERTASLEAVALRAPRVFAHHGWILDRKLDGAATLLADSQCDHAAATLLADCIRNVHMALLADRPR
jgi:hypothetical protein